MKFFLPTLLAFLTITPLAPNVLASPPQHSPPPHLHPVTVPKQNALHARIPSLAIRGIPVGDGASSGDEASTKAGASGGRGGGTQDPPPQDPHPQDPDPPPSDPHQPNGGAGMVVVPLGWVSLIGLGVIWGLGLR